MKWAPIESLMHMVLKWLPPFLRWRKPRRRLDAVWTPSSKPEPVAEPARPTVADIYAAGLVPPPQAEPAAEPVAEQRINRSRRRALERARRRYDKFVTPQGPTPIKQTRSPSTKRLPKLPEREVDDASLLIGDTHEYGGATDVLYEEAELWGEFQFRDTILDQLDRYFIYLKRMKLHDKDSYAFYRQVGITVLPHISVLMGREKDEYVWPIPRMTEEELKKYREEIYLPPAFKANRPSFGCFAFGIDKVSEQLELDHSAIASKIDKKKHKLMTPKFMYFRKYSKPPPEVQPMSGGDIYAMTLWWDRPHDPDYERKGGTPSEFAIFIGADGNKIQVLRMLETKHHRIHSRKKGRGVDAHGYFDVPERAWRIPDDYEKWAADYGLTAEEHLAHLFCDAVRRHECSNFSMVRISATRDDMTAVFGVNARRLSYFFQDRDIELTEGGVKRRVFHMVRPHERITKTGKKAVRMHFRGSKHFTWAGYSVSITIPGRDHLMLPEVDVGFEDEYWWEGDDRDKLSGDELGAYVVRWITTGVGGTK